MEIQKTIPPDLRPEPYSAFRNNIGPNSGEILLGHKKVEHLFIPVYFRRDATGDPQTSAWHIRTFAMEKPYHSESSGFFRPSEKMIFDPLRLEPKGSAFISPDSDYTNGGRQVVLAAWNALDLKTLSRDQLVDLLGLKPQAA
ncbi:MAG: hypothetical protein KGI60_03500 [Patescibacteria group bacterium]|nr:hypothetical protein [Patescibacteria group bacterium]